MFMYLPSTFLFYDGKFFQAESKPEACALAHPPHQSQFFGFFLIKVMF